MQNNPFQSALVYNILLLSFIIIIIINYALSCKQHFYVVAG